MIDDLAHHLKSPVRYRTNSGFRVEYMDACQTGMINEAGGNRNLGRDKLGVKEASRWKSSRSFHAGPCAEREEGVITVKISLPELTSPTVRLTLA